MKTILLTGASGFIGRYLTKQLGEDGYFVIGTSYKSGGVGNIACDLRDKDRVFHLVRDANPDIIVHAAALSSPTSGRTIEYYDGNVVCSENLFGAVQALSGRRRVLFLSTAGVYGNHDTEHLSEDLRPLPVSHYGLSKFVCERLLYGISNDHDITILRPFNVIGSGQEESFLVPKLVKHFARKTQTINLGNTQSKRDFISVGYCCRIISALISQPASHGQVVNLCSGVATSVSDLVHMLSTLTGHTAEIISDAVLVRTNEIWSLVGSIQKLTMILPDLVPEKSIDPALKDMLKFYQAQTE